MNQDIQENVDTFCYIDTANLDNIVGINMKKLLVRLLFWSSKWKKLKKEIGEKDKNIKEIESEISEHIKRNQHQLEKEKEIEKNEWSWECKQNLKVGKSWK